MSHRADHHDACMSQRAGAARAAPSVQAAGSNSCGRRRTNRRRQTATNKGSTLGLCAAPAAATGAAAAADAAAGAAPAPDMVEGGAPAPDEAVPAPIAVQAPPPLPRRKIMAEYMTLDACDKGLEVHEDPECDRDLSSEDDDDVVRRQTTASALRLPA